MSITRELALNSVIESKTPIVLFIGDPFTGLIKPSFNTLGYLTRSDNHLLFHYLRFHTPEDVFMTDIEVHTRIIKPERVLRIQNALDGELLFQTYTSRFDTYSVETYSDYLSYSDNSSPPSTVLRSKEYGRSFTVPPDMDLAEVNALLFGRVRKFRNTPFSELLLKHTLNSP